MIILVSDTSILIDLERGGLLEPAFTCGLTMVVPDLLYQRELEDHNGRLLRELGLGVVALTSHEVSNAQQLRSARSALSLPDCFALVCAARPGHALVTGDKVLRNEAQARLGSVFGLLWILDQMEASGQVQVTALHEGLTRISNHPRCRLPAGAIRTRLDRWSKSDS